jgi:hypothetical protein
MKLKKRKWRFCENLRPKPSIYFHHNRFYGCSDDRASASANRFHHKHQLEVFACVPTRRGEADVLGFQKNNKKK